MNRRRLDEPPPEWSEPDIYDYGVEGILIVEHDLLVDLLVLNGLHSRERVLIVSLDLYPTYLVPVAAELLREREDLPVYLLHDATASGVTMLDRLAATDTFPITNHPTIDLGITPDDVRRLRRLRPMKPKRFDYEAPIDFLLSAELASGLAQAFFHRVSLARVLEEDQADRDGAGGGFG